MLLHDACATPQRTLLAADPVARARAREIAEVVNAGIQPLQNLSHTKAISAAAEGADGRKVGAAAIAKGLAAAEALACKNRDARYCVGSHTSVADLCLIPQLYNARRFEVGRTLEHAPRACSPHSMCIPPCVWLVHPLMCMACASPCVWHVQVDLKPYPRLCAIEAHAETLPHFKAARPEVQPDAVDVDPKTRG